MSFELIQALLAQLGVLAIMFGGLLLIVLGTTSFGRVWFKRLVWLGILFAVVAGIITPAWLP